MCLVPYVLSYLLYGIHSTGLTLANVRSVKENSDVGNTFSEIPKNDRIINTEHIQVIDVHFVHIGIDHYLTLHNAGKCFADNSSSSSLVP